MEVAFFSRWWRAQRAPRRRAVAALVRQARPTRCAHVLTPADATPRRRQGRLVFANGGWCMHDEAAATYSDMLDQTALGAL